MSENTSRVVPIPLGFVSAFAVRGDRCILIDTGMAGSTSAIVSSLATSGIALSDISLILLTHSHMDHIGSVADLKERTGAPVAIHRLEADALRTGRSPVPRPHRAIARLLSPVFSRVGPARARPCEPDVLIDGEMDLASFGVDGRIIPTPGHTLGSVSVTLASGEAIVGDLIGGSWLNRRHPTGPMWADDLDQMRSSILKVLDLFPTTIYASHGGPFDPQAVRRWMDAR